MSSNAPSAKFLRLYESLPSDVQSSVVAKHLAPLLDSVSKEKSHKVVSIVNRMQKKFANIPILDLRAKRTEINALMDELHRDSKCSFVKERSNSEELLMELIDSLLDWLNHIWRIVYEFRTNFTMAHNCLLFACDILENISNARMGCKCSFLHLFVPVSIKRMSGKTVKSWSFTGAQHMDEVLLWIWRDLFVTMLAYSSKEQKKTIPSMLNDIQSIMGWSSLERLLQGGANSSDTDDDDDDNDDTDVLDDNDLNDTGSACSEVRCPCGFHGFHWTSYLNEQRTMLRELVRDALLSVFRVTPSVALFRILHEVSLDEDETDELTSDILSSVATYSSDNFAAALNIFSIQNKTENIVSLLESYSHLLRPRDATSLQLATLSIATYPSRQLYSLQILDKELIDSAHAIRASLIGCFVHMESDKNKAELASILELEHNSLRRKTRVVQWVEGVATPGSGTPHPMVLAAMMMGLPFPGGMDDGEDGDALTYMAFEQDDADLDDLRDEFRPRLKERFEGWVETGRSIKGGPAVLLTAYKKIIDFIPCTQGSDVIEEMLNHLGEKPSKTHVSEGLTALNKFCKQQKKKLASNAKSKSGKTAASRGNMPAYVTPGSASTNALPLLMDDVD